MAIAGITVGFVIGIGLAFVAGSFASSVLPVAFTAHALGVPVLAAAAAGGLATFAFTAAPLARARAVSPAILLRAAAEDGEKRRSQPGFQAGAALLLLIAFTAATAPDRRIVVYAAVGAIAGAHF